MGTKPPNPAQQRNLLHFKWANEAMRAFVAHKTGVEPSAVCLPDLVHEEHVVDLLTALRHWAGDCGLDYPKADRQARGRHQREVREEAQEPIQE